MTNRAPHGSESRSRDVDDFERLDRLVRTLLKRFEAARSEVAALRGKLEDRDARIDALEEQILESNQTRRDAAKRLDDLVAQLDHLDARLSRVQKDRVPADEA